MDSSEAIIRTRTGHWSSGFAWLRLPRFSYEIFEEWIAVDENAVDQINDRSQPNAPSQQWLQDFFFDDDMQEALYVASPSLYAAFTAWTRSGKAPTHKDNIDIALAKYLGRCCYRATPFGLFSTVTTVALSDKNDLDFGPDSELIRHTRLDGGKLEQVCHTLNRDRRMREHLRYWPNTSLYAAGDVYRYSESTIRNGRRKHSLSEIASNQYLNCVLETSRGSAKLTELAYALSSIDRDLESEEINEYLNELIDTQVLVSGLWPPITGPDPLRDTLAQLDRSKRTSAASGLQRVATVLESLDQDMRPKKPNDYQPIEDAIATYEIVKDDANYVQIDLQRRTNNVSLSRRAVSDVFRAAELLNQLSPRSNDPMLDTFRQAFVARFGDREVPLLEALDDDFGIGFAHPQAESNIPVPLLSGLSLPSRRAAMEITWTSRDEYLLGMIARTQTADEIEVKLSDQDIKVLSEGHREPLPNSFVSVVTLAGSVDDFRKNQHTIWHRHAFGPSGMQMLGRFCQHDPDLLAFVSEHIRREEALDEKSIFAEIVHAPHGRTRNVLSRPLLRSCEIAFLGKSGADDGALIHPQDLRVSVNDDKIFLRCAKRNARIIPRMTNAHAFGLAGHPVYRFLCALQKGSEAHSIWGGVLNKVPFVPRVRRGRVVLNRAKWRILPADRASLTQLNIADLTRFVTDWRKQRKIPRRVALSQGDRELPLDLRNATSLRTFQDVIKKNRRETSLYEQFPSLEPGSRAIVTVNGQPFTHELVVPFVRRPTETSESDARPRYIDRSRFTFEESSFGPGSNWLYLKLFCGKAQLENVLLTVSTEVAQQFAGKTIPWFFVRYSESGWHLRLRYAGKEKFLSTELLPHIAQILQPLLKTGVVSRFQTDTYIRELARYGGVDAIRHCEDIFCVDSNAFVSLIPHLETNPSPDLRWQLVLRCMHDTMEAFSLETADKLKIVRAYRDGFAREFSLDAASTKRLAAKYRAHRIEIEGLVSGGETLINIDEDATKVLTQRREHIAQIATKLQHGQQAGDLDRPLSHIIASLLHMHANRFLPDKARAQELVLSTFLCRAYETKLARGKSKK